MSRAAVYRQVAIGDLVLFTALAIPGLGGWLMDSLITLNQWIGLDGEWSPTPALYLFLHLLGALGAGYAYLRLHSTADTRNCASTAAVKLYATALFVLFVSLGAPQILLLLAMADAVLGLRLLMAIRQEK